jgi:hypothetical protein
LAGAQDLKWSNTDPLADIPDFAGPFAGSDKGFFPDAGTSDNTVTVPEGSTVDGTVAGGISPDQDVIRNVIGNKVTVTGSTVAESVLGAGTANGNSYDNRVNVTDSAVGADVTGGYTGAGAAYNNSVTISGGPADTDDKTGEGTGTGSAAAADSATGTGGITGDVTGGYSYKGNVYNNTVRITLGKVSGGINGGYADEGNVYNNTVEISGGTVKDINGGLAYGVGAATGNTVTISGTDAGDATDNTVTAGSSGTDVTGSVYGGSSENGVAADNTVTINDADSTVSGSIAGGYTRGAGNATGNSVTVNTGSINGTVYGGAAFDNGNAAGNTVNINGGTLAERIIGGYAAVIGNATGNTVNINGGETKNEVRGGYALGSGSATRNNVNIRNGSVTGNVYGGATLANGSATGNNVIISDGSVTGNVYGGLTQGTSATGNTVNVSGGTVRGAIYGGTAQAEDGKATGNIVTVSGGSVHGAIYGGSAQAEGGTATNNTVILAGKPDLSGVHITGGDANGNGDKFTGNTLVLREYTGGPVGQVSNFENYDITLPATISNGDVALEVESIDFGNGANKKSVLKSLNFPGGGTALAKGESVALFRKSDGSAVDTTNLELAEDIAGALQGRKGISLVYEYKLTDPLSGYTATVSDVHTNPQVKSLSEGHLAGLAFVNQGQNLLVTEGVRNAVSAAREGQGLSSFAAVSYGTSRYDTGSHVDVDGGSMLAGLAWGSGMRTGRLTLGAFFEAGMGSYDAHNSFNGYSSIKADGDTDYIGGGILGRFDFAATGPGHFYTEITGRIGRLENDFSSGDLRKSTGTKADYDSSGLYYGAHLGVGYIVNITNKASLDLYGKYLWTRQKGDSITLSSGDPIKFEDANSHRLHGGTRLTYAATPRIAPYIGAAYEHEFDGKAKATTYGQSIDAPKLKGGTGIGEVGVNIRPVAGTPLSFDLGVQGYLGVRQGLGGSLQLKYDF